MRAAVLTLLAALVAALHLGAATPADAPPLPPPDPAVYTVVDVSTAQELADACWSLESDQAIVIAPGTYDLGGVTFPNGGDGRLTVGRYGAPSIDNVQIRGSTGDPEDVQLLGRGMLDTTVPYGFQIFTATDVLIADLSIGEVYYHVVAIENGQGADRVRLYHTRLFDAGQQIVKANRGDGPGASDVVVEYSEIFYTDGAVLHPEGSPPNSCYTNGIDAIGGHDWIIRHNSIHHIRCQSGSLAGPAVLVWRGSTNTLIDGNTFRDCSRGVSLGLSPGDHTGGVVRNNFFRWDPEGTYAIDVPVHTASPDSQILHNTIIGSGTYRPTGEAVAVEVRYASAAGTEVRHNLMDGSVWTRDGASPVVTDNETGAEPEWFVDERAADLHLAPAGSAAVDRVTRLPAAVEDFDGYPRPTGLLATDLGAAELVPTIFTDGFEGGDVSAWSASFP